MRFLGYLLQTRDNRSTWWLCVAHGGASTNACNVNNNGEANNNLTTNAGIRAPL